MGLALLAIAWAGFLFFIGSPVVLLFTAPLFMLAAPLALGRYLGEGLVERLSTAFRATKPRATRTIGGPRFSTLAIARGGQILASTLAGRGPPPIPA